MTADPGAECSLRLLSAGYAAAVDNLDGAGFAALFVPEGELWVPDGAAGPDPLICRRGLESLRRVPSGLARFHATHHRVGRTSYEIDADGATGEVTAVAHHLAARPDHEGGDGPGTDTIWYLRYADVYLLTEGGWRFARRALHLRGIEERPIPHLGPAREGPGPGAGTQPNGTGRGADGPT